MYPPREGSALLSSAVMSAQGTDQISTSVRMDTVTHRGPAVPMATSRPNGPPETEK